MTKMPTREELKIRPNLSILALISFAASFVVARMFTTVNPDTVLVSGGFHIHHFWFGLAALAVGGWLGISYDSEHMNRLAAILFGSGGGLIGDEIGLLLTFGNYWSGITYTFVIVFMTSASALILLNRYSRAVLAELSWLASRSASLYIGVFVALVSIAFVAETENFLIIAFSSVSTVAGCLIIIAYFIHRLRRR